MTPANPSLAEGSTSVGVASMDFSMDASCLQDSGVGADQISRSEYVRVMQETQLTDPQDTAIIEPLEVKEEQTASLATSDNSLASSNPSSKCVLRKEEFEKRRTTYQRAAAAVANAAMAEQAKEEEEPLDIMLAEDATLEADVTASTQEKSLQSETGAQFISSRNPPRADTATITARTAQQTTHKAEPLEQFASSILIHEDMDMEKSNHGTKKRTTKGAGPAAKRSRVSAAKVLHKTMKSERMEPHVSRGKKRRQAAAYKSVLVEASPVITDLPPLPFTSTSSELRIKSKNKSKTKYCVKSKTKLTSPVTAVDSDSRRCEFCKKAANICVLMNCHACRRVYHAQCIVRAFRPYVDVNLPILGQMERLQLEVPERRGNIFRCASCKAAFLDFYESGGYMWDCECPTCSQPENTLLYRQRKLVQMMKDMKLEKQRKKEEKDRRKHESLSEKLPTPTPTPTQLNVTSHSPQTQKDSITPDDHVTSFEKFQLSTFETQGIMPQGDELAKHELIGEPNQSELSGDDLVGAVQVLYDDTSGRWCFPVMCSRTPSLGDSGIRKTGKCKWLSEKETLIQCSCCDKIFDPFRFVHHTDSSLIENAKAASKDSMPFLFVEHRDRARYTLLEDFQPALSNWSGRQSVSNSTPAKCLGVKQETTADTPTMITQNPDSVTDALQTSMSRLQALALFKRPKHKGESDKSSHLIDSTSLDFVAQIVCLPPSYVMNMQNGTLADRVVRSKTAAPGDSFPRKAGWLCFGRNPALAHQITCFCCEQNFGFDDFVCHAGISLSTLQKRSCQLLYVVEREDASALVPFKTFLSDLEFITTNGVDLLLDELQPATPSLRLI